MIRILVLLAAIAVAAPAMALEDRATGLKVELPPAYEVRQVPPLSLFEAVIGINLTSGETFGANAPNLCEVTFDHQPGWIGLTQERFNDKLGEPAYPYQYARQVSAVFTVIRSERFEIRGIVGQEFVMMPRTNPALVAVTSVMETPAGSTAVTCLAASRDLERAMPAFRAILAGVTPPSGER